MEIDVPPERVWPYVATQEGYRRWSCTIADPYKVVLEGRVGGRYTEQGTVGHESWSNVGEVLVYEPARRIAFTLQTQRGDGSRSPVTVVTIRLEDLGGRTRVTLEHDLTRLEPARREEKFRSFDVGWHAALTELRILVESTPAAAGTASLAVHKEIEIDAPPDRVWPYVATAEGCRKWFCTVAQHYDLVLEPEVGGRYEQRMLVKGRSYHSVGEVLVYDPPRRFIYSSRQVRSDGGFPVPTTAAIRLYDLGGRTRVSVTERGFDLLDPDAREEARRSTDQGWAAAMEDLYGVLIQGVLPALGRLLIHQTIEIAAPAERVWQYIATEDGRREHLRCRYPATQIEVEHFEPRAGGVWESAGISAHTGDRYRQSGRILRCDPPHLLVMTFQEDGWPTETMVTYRLSEYFGRTRLTLVHSGFEKLPPARRLLTWKAYEIGRFKSLEPLRDLVAGRKPAVQHPLMIRKEIEINAPIERVWWYVGTQEGSLARHRAEHTPGRVAYEAEILEPRPGGRYELRGIYEGAPFLITGQVLAYDPPAVLALSWQEEGWPVETLVRFRLTEEHSRTRVTVIHNGFEHLPPEVRQRELRGYEIGRVRGLEVLRALAERPAADGADGAMAGETPAMWTVRKTIEIAAPATAVWSFVGTEDGLRTWWASSTRRILLEPQVGGRFEIVVEFSRLYTIVGQVTAYDPPRQIAFTWRETDGDQVAWPADTLVTFTLDERNGRTVVMVEHSGFERLPDACRREALRSYEHGWTDEEMERLRQLVLQAVASG